MKLAMGFLTTAGYLLTCQVCRSLQVRDTAAERLWRKLRAGREQVVLVFWHNRLFFLTYYLSTRLIQQGCRLSVLISQSRDGEFAARLARRFGATVIRGSTSRRALAGLRALVATTAYGHCPVITPDGPRGPRYQVQPGVVAVARTSGLPVVPISYRTGRFVRLNSWDRFIIPAPYSSVEVVVGEPLAPPPRGQEHRFCQRLREQLMRLGAD